MYGQDDVFYNGAVDALLRFKNSTDKYKTMSVLMGHLNDDGALDTLVNLNLTKPNVLIGEDGVTIKSGGVLGTVVIATNVLLVAHVSTDKTSSFCTDRINAIVDDRYVYKITLSYIS